MGMAESHQHYQCTCLALEGWSLLLVPPCWQHLAGKPSQAGASGASGCDSPSGLAGARQMRHPLPPAVLQQPHQLAAGRESMHVRAQEGQAQFFFDLTLCGQRDWACWCCWCCTSSGQTCLSGRLPLNQGAGRHLTAGI